MEVFWEWILQHAGISSTIAVVLLTGLIEIAPIKINPWTALKKLFTAPIETAAELKTIKEDIDHVKVNTNKIDSLQDRVETLGGEVINLSSRVDAISDKLTEEHNGRIRQHIIDLRREILKFGDDLLCQANLSQEHYQEIIRAIDEYEDYCDIHPDFQNNQCLMTIQLIKESYKKKFLRLPGEDEEK